MILKKHVDTAEIRDRSDLNPRPRPPLEPLSNAVHLAELAIERDSNSRYVSIPDP
jgi:hypothetical protein